MAYIYISNKTKLILAITSISKSIYSYKLQDSSKELIKNAPDFLEFGANTISNCILAVLHSVSPKSDYTWIKVWIRFSL